MFRQVCEHLIFDITEAIDHKAQTDRSLADSALTAFFQLLSEHPDLARVFLVETDHHDPEMLKVGRGMLDQLAALIAPDVADPLARVGAIGAVLRMARFWIEGDYAEPVPHMAALGRRFVDAAG